MKTIFYLLLLPVLTFSQVKVNINVLQKQTYCGGARPTPEITAQYEKPIPYANKKLIIVSSNGKVDSTTTTSKGYLKVRLKPGTYKLYEPWRYHKQTPNGSDIKNFDKDCLQKQWDKIDVIIDAQKKRQQITMDIDDTYCPHTLPCVLNPQMPE